MKEYTGKEMNFTSNQQEIFKQNINALVNEILRKNYKKLKILNLNFSWVTIT